MQPRTRIPSPWSLALIAAVVLRALPAMADPLVVSQPPNDCGDPENKFGRALAPVGSRLLVGAPGEVCGYAHLINAKTGAALLTLQSPVNLEANGFGTAVAALGRDLLVSAPREEAVYLFDGRTGALRQTFDNPSGPFEGFGAAVVAIDRQRVAVGAPAAGVVHIFDVATGSLIRSWASPTPQAPRQFGRSLAMSGRWLVVGAPGNSPSSVGAAFLTAPELDGAIPLISPDPAPGDRFGAAVAGTRRYALVGAPGTNTAYVYDTRGVLVRELAHSNGTAGEAFGSSAAIRGTRALLGAPFFDPGDSQGGAFLFSRGSGLILDSVNGFDFQDAAGTSVALLRNGYAVGAPTQGAGYVLIVR